MNGTYTLLFSQWNWKPAKAMVHIWFGKMAPLLYFYIRIDFVFEVQLATLKFTEQDYWQTCPYVYSNITGENFSVRLLPAMSVCLSNSFQKDKVYACIERCLELKSASISTLQRTGHHFLYSYMLIKVRSKYQLPNRGLGSL